MKYHLTAVLAWIGTLQTMLAQPSDTLYWSESTQARQITYHLQDSIHRIVEFSTKGKVVEVKHEQTIQGMFIPVYTDSIWSASNPDFFALNKHQHQFLGDVKVSDSLLKVETISLFFLGEIRRSYQMKTYGSYAQCPCGQWQFYEDHRLDFDTTFISCYTSEVNNIQLTKTSWSPDSNYYAELYKEQMLMAMPGQGGDHMATIILKQANGNIIKLVSSASGGEWTTMHREVSMRWAMDRNTFHYGKARSMKLESEARIQGYMRMGLASLQGEEDWMFYKLPQSYGHKSYAYGDFYGDGTTDLAVLVHKKNGPIELRIVNDFRLDTRSCSANVLDLDYGEIGIFKRQSKKRPIWSNYIEDGPNEGFREYIDVPEKEVIFLPYDAIYVHAGESCGGGYVFWQNEQWNWRQQE